MNEMPHSNPAKEGRTAVRRYTFVLVPLLWCMGFCCSHFWMGCDMPLAISKATAYTLSWMGGWLVYFVIWKPSNLWSTPWLIVGTNVALLNPTRTTWPFREMLAHGLIVSISLVLLWGPVMRWLERTIGTKAHSRSSVHPLSNDQVA